MGGLRRSSPLSVWLAAFIVPALLAVSAGALSAQTKQPPRLVTNIAYGHYISVQFASDGRHVLAGTDKGSVELWDAGSGRLLRAFKPAHTERRDYIVSAAFSPLRNAVVAGDRYGRLRVWASRTGDLIQMIEDAAISNFSIAFSADENFLVSSGDEEAKLWDARTWKPVRAIAAKGRTVAVPNKATLPPPASSLDPLL